MEQSENKHLTSKLAPFGTTIFSTINELAAKHKAINLSQGVPNFPGPQFIKQAACDSIMTEKNQYAPGEGIDQLRQAIAEKYQSFYDIEFDPKSEISVYTGCTGAIFATCMGVLNPADEVILFEPFYDSYEASIAMAGAIPKAASLVHPKYEIDFAQLESLITHKTRMMFINTPHNPTGKVFSYDELKKLASFCIKHDLICVTDEVYEHLIFDDNKHYLIQQFDGMQERTITLNSTGKTFSLTGWKIGYAVGAASLIEATRKANQFITFCTATPLQWAMAEAIRCDHTYYDDFIQMYTKKREKLCNILKKVGFTFNKPQGTYFILADFTNFGFDDDIEFAKYLIEEIGVAAIPPSVFYQNEKLGKHLIRFAFCKTDEVLDQAAERLVKL